MKFSSAKPKPPQFGDALVITAEIIQAIASLPLADRVEIAIALQARFDADIDAVAAELRERQLRQNNGMALSLEMFRDELLGHGRGQRCRCAVGKYLLVEQLRKDELNVRQQEHG